MKIYLVDGTYELFRNHFGAPPKKAPNGQEVGATLGLLRSLYMLVTGEEPVMSRALSIMSSSFSATSFILDTRPARG